jgi:hypothetical protein
MSSAAGIDVRPPQSTPHLLQRTPVGDVAGGCHPRTGITIAVFLLAALALDEPLGRSDMVLCLLVFALTFPGSNRFGQRPLNAAVDVLGFFDDRDGRVHITLPLRRRTLDAQPRSITLPSLSGTAAGHHRQRSSSCPTCSASASSRAGCRT